MKTNLAIKVRQFIRTCGIVEGISRPAGLLTIIALLFLSGAFSLYGVEGESQTHPPARISLEEVFHRALEKNFDIRLARIEQRINLLNLPA
ncbi:MAG: hypothetical protein U9N73_04910, partial [Candidatus Auribacterota bacterium]|nr:hypothetical protein [Candidatus Auribacterota bacterium]